MNGLLRYFKFNVVGAMGMGVQLGSLWLLQRAAPGHYLLASGVAVELAVLHNYLWHARYTWRESPGRGGAVRQFLRFQAGNGLVSMAGNLLLMRLLVQGLGSPVLAANLVAITCCSAANFWIGEVWVFAGARPGARQIARPRGGPSARMLLTKRLIQPESAMCQRD